MVREKTLDMTKGNPLRHIIWFGIPLIIGNIFQQFYSMVDAIIVGRTIGINALAAVGATGAPVFFVLGFAMGLAGGFAIMISQRFGAGDMDGMRRSVAMGAMLSGAFALVLMAVSVVGAKALLVAMNTPEEILPEAHSYILVIFWGIPATMFYNYISSVIRALGDSKTPLYFLLIASVLNVVLDFVLILNFQMGVKGAAVATLISQAVSGLLCLLYVGKFFPALHLKPRDWKFDWKFAWYHLRLGVPMAVQTSVIAIGSLVVQAMLNSFGAIAVAGYTAANKLEQLSSQVMMSLGLTLATYVGQNYGARNLDRIKEGVKKTAIILLITSGFFAILMTFFGRELTYLFVGADQENVEDVVRYSRQYLTISVCFYPVLSCIYIFRNALQGMGNTGIVLIGSAVELLGRMAGALLLSIPFGYVGVCFAAPLAWLGGAILFVIVYFVDIRKFTRKLRSGDQEKVWNYI